jgi:hypothetical protein
MDGELPSVAGGLAVPGLVTNTTGLVAGPAEAGAAPAHAAEQATAHANTAAATARTALSRRPSLAGMDLKYDDLPVLKRDSTKSPPLAIPR